MANQNQSELAPVVALHPSPKRKRVQRRDGWINSASGHGTARDRRTLTRYGVDIVTDLEAAALWRSEWLAAKIIEKRPQEIFRRGYEIKSADTDPEKLAKVLTRAQELELDKRLVKLEEYRYAYGGGVIYPAMKGGHGETSEPLVEEAIESVEAFHLLEPRELQPETYYTDLNSPKFGRPETYRLVPLTTGRMGVVSSQIVHESRLIIAVGTRVSRQTQPGQRESWGDSGLSRNRAALADYGLTWGGAATILSKYGHRVLSMDGMAEILTQPDGESLMTRRLDAMSMAESALGITPIDGKDKLSELTISLAGYADVLEQQAYFVSAAAGYPISILLGMIKGGLSTGDNDVRAWYADVDNYRNAETKPLLEQGLRLIMKSTRGPLKGDEPKVWSAAFRPLWEPTEKEQAETFKTYAEADKTNIDAQVYSADDAAKSRYGGDGFGTKITIDFKAREAQRKIDDERADKLADADLAAMGRTKDEDPPAEDDRGAADELPKED